MRALPIVVLCFAALMIAAPRAPGAADRGLRSPPGEGPAAGAGNEGAPAAEPALQGTPERPYRLGPGDVLSISVWRDENLTRDVVVPPDGELSFPLAGAIQAGGLTVRELQAALKKRLDPLVPDAPVTVLLVRPESMTASVIGKVNRPGQFPINMETRAIQLLAAAGGVTPFASAGKILILRQSGDKTVKLPFDYNEVKSGENLEQNVLLERWDVIVVP